MERERPALRAPNFFLVGAPRCGTTSLTHWLAGHERVFLATPKEPNFYADDVVTPRAIRDEARYRRLFTAATPAHLAVGEASTPYLRSRVAVLRILAAHPEARFVACVRDPVAMVRSVHAQMVRSGREPERSFARAWALQERRRAGRDLPAHCPEPADLQYRAMGALGSQLRRLMEAVPEGRVHVVVLDDLATDPAGAYRGVLRFLGVPDDGRQRFPVHNVGAEPRSLALAGVMSRLLHGAAAVGVEVPAVIRRAGMRLNERPPAGRRAELPDGLRTELREAFAGEVALLSRLLRRDPSAGSEGRSLPPQTLP